MSASSNKRKIEDLSADDDDGGGFWSSEIIDPNQDEATIELHLSNIESFVKGLRDEVGRNSCNAETLLKALWKEANDLCKTNAFHKSLSAIVSDVVDSDDDLSDVEEVNIKSISDQKEKNWMIMFQQLREYRIDNGDCKVPMKYKPNPQLGSWVNNQKSKYKKKKLKPHQIGKLDGIGMTWGKNFPPPVSWQERFDELLKHKKVRGDCNVRYNEASPTPLARWVVAQRAEYKRFQKGCDSLLTLDQIEQLKGIGMRWKNPKS